MSKSHKATPLKLTDERVPYTYQRTVDIAAELQEEQGETISSQTIELARLQTEVADLRERNAELEAELGKLENELIGARETSHKKDIRITHLTRWAKTWKRAATVNWRARQSLLRMWWKKNEEEK